MIKWTLSFATVLALEQTKGEGGKEEEEVGGGRSVKDNNRCKPAGNMGKWHTAKVMMGGFIMIMPSRSSMILPGETGGGLSARGSCLITQFQGA